MDIYKRGLSLIVAGVLKAAAATVDTASFFGMYQPKQPQELTRIVSEGKTSPRDE